MGGKGTDFLKVFSQKELFFSPTGSIQSEEKNQKILNLLFIGYGKESSHVI
jgi:hypothetical protein